MPLPQGWLVVLAWLLACVILATYRTWLARRARAAVELGESLRAPSVPWSHGDDTGGGGGGGGDAGGGGGGSDSGDGRDGGGPAPTVQQAPVRADREPRAETTLAHAPL